MAYDSVRGKVVLFGGSYYNGINHFYRDDTWEWDGTTWTLRTPVTKPWTRFGHSMAYDSVRGKVVLFGGYGGSYLLNDTWEWDGSNWTLYTPATKPSVRYYHAMTYDSVRGKVVLFGGDNGSNLNDTWEWDGTNWTQRSPATTLSARSGHSMAYDSAQGKVVLFGGSYYINFSNLNINDTWEWDGTTWTDPSLASGNHSWFVCACDAASNCTRSSQIWTARVDSAAPIAFNLQSPADGNWSNGSGVTFQWQAATDVDSGLAYYRLFIDAAQQGGYLTSTSYVYPGTLASGAHQWYVVAYDNVGNTIQSTNTFTLNMDSTAPAAFTLLAPTDGTTTTDNTPTLSWNASGDSGSGLDHYRLIVDPAGTGDKSGSNYTNYSFGPNSGTWVESPIAITGAGTVDHVSAYYKFNHGYWGDVRIILVSPSGTEYALFNQEGGGSSGNYSETVSNITAFAGQAASGTWKLRAEDWAGGDAGYIDEWTVSIFLQGGGTGGIDVSLPATSTTYTVPGANALGDGSHSWLVKAYDVLGNEQSTSTRSFTIDTTPPVAFFLSSPADGSYSSIMTPQVCWLSTTDAVSGLAKYKLYEDGNLLTDNIAPSTNCEYLFINEGTHTWHVVAVDNVGHERLSPQRTVVGEWNIPYAFDLTAPLNGTTVYSSNPVFSWNASGDAGSGLCRYELYIDGVCRDTCNIAPNVTNYQVQTPVAYGTGHPWYVKAVDCAGSVRNSTQVWNFNNYECNPTTVEHCNGNDEGVCYAGDRTCSAQGTWGSCAGVIPPSSELCDSLDNDCDGAPDDGYPNKGLACSLGQGICRCDSTYICSGDGAQIICDCAPGIPAPAEVCNGLDDDCDGVTDEDFPSIGGICYAGVGECKRQGTMVCKGDGSGVECSVVPGAPESEICDGKDNNCDGTPDENFSDLGLSCGVGIGACRRDGQYVCKPDGSGTECSVTSGSSTAELCDGADNDCDGKIDEDFALGGDCASGVGECQVLGVYICKADGSGVKCNAVAASSQTETCGDGLDNDCNGSADENCDCQAGVQRPCRSDVGECSAGTQVCLDGSNKWGSCVLYIGFTVELCDDKDNDCDGITDEGCGCSTPGATRVCGSDDGECISGIQTCETVSVRWSECEGATLSVPELCDGFDNDCDGVPDENFPELSIACAIGVGECVGSGAFVCDTISGWGAICDAIEIVPSNEICDGLDNNCDGDTDENFLIGQSCVNGTGVCKCNGIYACDGMSAKKCDCAPGIPTGELCDGFDNDCDGSIDENFTDLGAPCADGTGVCAANGVRVCKADGFGTECNAVPGMAFNELCNGLDDDCNGLTDEDFPLGDACTAGVGACGRDGQYICKDDGYGVECDAVPNSPQADICGDLVDNDCDGLMDETCVCVMGETNSCGSNVGECISGTQICVDGGKSWGPCQEIVGSSPELCDGLDNDCDGLADEVFVGLGKNCIFGIGACAALGTGVCASDGFGLLCDGIPGIPEDEICDDGLDNDCDGAADDLDDDCQAKADGGTEDSGVDAGREEDAGFPEDAAVGNDAGASEDAGITSDASVAQDSGFDAGQVQEEDAGVVDSGDAGIDAGSISRIDAGITSDASVPKTADTNPAGGVKKDDRKKPSPSDTDGDGSSDASIDGISPMSEKIGGCDCSTKANPAFDFAILFPALFLLFGRGRRKIG